MINMCGHVITDEGKPLMATFSETEAGAIDNIWNQVGSDQSPFRWWAEQQRLPKGYRVICVWVKEEDRPKKPKIGSAIREDED